MTITAGVAAGHPATAQAGGDILAAGGSAADAAVGDGADQLRGGDLVHRARAAAASPSTTTPPPVRPAAWTSSSSIPGLGGRSPGRGQPIEVVFVGQAIPYEIGPPTVAVPGIPAGVLHLWRRWGRLPWAEVVAPGRAASLGSAFPSTHADLLPKVSPAIHVSDGIEVYSRPDGSTLQAGDLVAHPAHPQAYDLLAADPECLLHRRVRRAVLDGRSATRRPWRPTDLEAYRVIETKPRRVGVARLRRAGPGQRPRRRAGHHAGRRRRR